MNKVALLVAACCAVVGLCGFGMGLNTCDSSEESIRHCIVVIFDRNKDGVITMDELERSFKDRVTYDSNLNATMVMRGGEKTSVTVLTEVFCARGAGAKRLGCDYDDYFRTKKIPQATSTKTVS
jgi:hypothetical protein